MSRTTFATLGLAFSALLLSGCTTVNELYPRFKEQSAHIRSMAVTTDVLILEDVKGPLPLVDVPRDTALAESISQYFRQELEKRGYAVTTTEHSSIGLRYASAVTPAIKVRAAGQSADLALDALGTATGPFYLAPAYTEPARRGSLQNAFEDMRRYIPKAGTPNVISRAVRELGPLDGASHRLFVLVEGVQVPMGKGLTQALTTGLLSLGTVSVFQMTTVNFRIGLADAATGEFILISDCTLAGGWTVDDAYLRRQAGVFFAHVDRLKNKPSNPN